MTRQARWVKEQRRLLEKRFGDRCFLNCGEERRLEFAHKKPTGLNGEGRGRANRICDIRKNPDAYVLLCPDCHKKFDQGLMELVHG